MTWIAKYVYALTLFLRTNNMPTYSHTHMITYYVVHFQALEIKLLWPDYYLPNSHLMFPQTMTLPAATICITWNSNISRLRHILRYINCSYSMYFTSSNINLDSLPPCVPKISLHLYPLVWPLINGVNKKLERAQHISWSHIVSPTNHQPTIISNPKLWPYENSITLQLWPYYISATLTSPTGLGIIRICRVYGFKHICCKNIVFKWHDNC